MVDKLRYPLGSPETLPINTVLPKIGAALASEGRVIVSAPPGSGKTTVLPLELIRKPWLQGRKIIVLQPRRLAVRAAAGRMSDILGEAVGGTVGYQVRLDRRISEQTKIEVVTEGILTRRIQHDPELSDIGLIVFDEFHERTLHADLALALTLDVRDNLRDDLRLLIMSATLDVQKVSDLLGGAPVVEGQGRSYPVDVRYLAKEPRDGVSRAAARAVMVALKEQQGDMLVFLPGAREIRDTAAIISQHLGAESPLIYMLHGSANRQLQDRAIRPDPNGRRKVVLSTSIAETSLTIEGVSTVVDGGWSRLPSFDPNNGLTRLNTVRLSLASATQRMGRAGRLGPGVCYRLWTRAVQARLQPTTSPEILEADLAGMMLEIAQWGVSNPRQLRWIDPPPGGAVSQAQQLLVSLCALSEAGRITATGRRMLNSGLQPRLAHMLVMAGELGVEALGADLAALIAERDVFRRGIENRASVDIEERLALLERLRTQGETAVAALEGDVEACRRVLKLSTRLCKTGKRTVNRLGDRVTPGLLLALAYPDRIAKRRSKNTSRYLLVKGRGVRLPDGDPLTAREYLVAVELDAGQKEGLIYRGCGVDLEDIRKSPLKRGIKITSEVEWDSGSRSVVAKEEERMGNLILASRSISNPDRSRVLSALLEGIRSLGLESLPWSKNARDWQARVLCLRLWQPNAGWPDVSLSALSGDLDHWLAPWLEGITRYQQLQQLNLGEIVKNRLDWSQQQLIAELAPTHLSLPSGSRRKLDYRPGGIPILAVRIQEMFGCRETPSVCAGQVRVKLHLLSPAGRPVQITRDLMGFWERTYTEIRKELKGRYPKHYWPENPLTAEATKGIKSKHSPQV